MTDTEDSGHKLRTGHSGCAGRIAPQQKSSTAEREYRGRGNLHNPLWKHQGRAARAAAARLLRAHTLTHGYDQRQVDELIRGIIMPGQQPLF